MIRLRDRIVSCILEVYLKRKSWNTLEPTGEPNIENELRKYGFSLKDLEELATFGETLPDTPGSTDSSLIVSGNVVKRRDKSALGRVRMLDGQTRQVHECRLYDEPGCCAFFSERRVYLLSSTPKGATKVTGLVTARRWRKGLRAERPLGAVD